MWQQPAFLINAKEASTTRCLVGINPRKPLIHSPGQEAGVSHKILCQGTTSWLDQPRLHAQRLTSFDEVSSHM